MTNLINNSIQAMPDGGKLEITAFENGGKLIIEVSDSGSGIPDEVKSRMFEPLMTTKSKGQGFGLAVVKRLVDALGGKITFVSEEGKGTTFSIKLSLL
jgi:signal transduction histidine kinase